MDNDHILVSIDKFGICKVSVREFKFELVSIYLEGIRSKQFTKIMSDSIISGQYEENKLRVSHVEYNS